MHEGISSIGANGDPEVDVSVLKGTGSGEVMSPYNKYLKAKAQIKTNSGSAIGECVPDLSRIIAYDLVNVSYGQRRPYHILRDSAMVFIRPHIEIAPEVGRGKTLFCIGRYKRPDYYEVFEYILNRSEVGAVAVDDADSHIRIDLNPRHLIRAFKALRGTVKFIGIFGWFNLLCRLTFLGRLYEHILPLIRRRKFSSVVVFSSAHPFENVVCQAAKSCGIRSYSMQHAVYQQFPKPTPMDNFLFDNHSADCHMCWGGLSRDAFLQQGLPPDELVICGYPRDVSTKSLCLPEGIESRKIRVLIALSRKVYEQSNFELLRKIDAEAFSEEYEFHVKLHPRLKTSDYLKYAGSCVSILDDERTLSELLRSGYYDCGIAVNTTAYYEFYLNSIVCFRYRCASSEVREPILADELDAPGEIRARLEQMDLSQVQQEVDVRLAYIFGLGLDGYARLLNEHA